MFDPDLINLENLYKTEIKPQIQAQNQIQDPNAKGQGPKKITIANKK